MFEHLPPLERMKRYADIENKRARERWGHVNLQSFAMAMPNKGGSTLNTPDDVKREIVKMRNNGSTKAEISKALGVSDHTIRRASIEFNNELKIPLTMKEIRKAAQNG
jgi:DNA invertase Pin-like site-specific DNA recombinase